MIFISISLNVFVLRLFFNDFLLDFFLSLLTYFCWHLPNPKADKCHVWYVTFYAEYTIQETG